MHKFIVAAFLLTASPVFAEIITLECHGANAIGETRRDTVRFNEVTGLVDDGSFPVTKAVTADQVRAMRMIIDRKTGHYVPRFPKDPQTDFTGKCAPIELSF